MKNKKKCSSIGGQAVLEGVMMRSESVSATAVRDPYGNIQIESERFVPLKERSKAYKIPVIRGIINFFSSMALGMKTITRSAEVFADDIQHEEPSKAEKWLAKKFKVDIMQITTGIGVVLGLLFAVALFIFLPTFVTGKIYDKNVVDLSMYSPYLQSLIKNLTSGAIKLTIFVLYILSVSLMKDIKRLFRYHGAEHKTISAYEYGLELTVENVQKMKTSHDRCGSTFIVIVLFSSIILLSLLPWFEQKIYNYLIRLALVPVIMGISYEFLKLFVKYDNFLTKILKAPGLLLQKLTVKEPDDEMVEVAIAAFKKVLEMEADPEIKPVSFSIYISMVKAKKKLAEMLAYEGVKRNYTEAEKEERKEEIAREVELILMAVLGLTKHSELSSIVRISAVDMDKAKDIATRRQSGEPLQYAIGETNFYGIDFIVDKRALIPRFETEILAEKAVKEIESRSDSCEVLDICTGSGVIAISIKKLTNANVVASDVSASALSLAKENAAKNEVEIDFIHSDLFEKITGNFDVITANPPYIKEEDISGLDEEVKNFEPILALNGGVDGLDYYRRISKEYNNYLKPGGVMFLEIGIGQKEDIEKLFGENVVEVYEDYNTPKIPRIVKIKANN